MLKYEDGFQRGRVEVKSEVAHLQRLLNALGFEVECDGLFGSTTASIISAFQRQQQLADTGIVDDVTWQKLEQMLLVKDKPELIISPVNDESSPDDAGSELEVGHEPHVTLAHFHGDLDWIHAQEGHNGKAYWPGGSSGVTLDPGFDLGYQTEESVKAFYQSILSAAQLSAINEVVGLIGENAQAALASSPVLQSIRVSRSHANKVFPLIALPYWLGIVRRMKGLDADDTPGSVQTALLSLAFNRGINNKGLQPLVPLIQQCQWHQCADVIAGMQQDHKLRGIRLRRQREAALIKAVLDS